MDRLEEMFLIQDKLNQHIREKRGLEHFSQEEWMQKFTLAMLSEMAELLDEVNFKWWKNAKPLDFPAMKEELVDIFHFFLSMCLASGMNAEELYQIYMKKNEENLARQDGKSQKAGYAMD